MQDVVFVAVVLLFLWACLLYIRGAERL